MAPLVAPSAEDQAVAEAVRDKLKAAIQTQQNYRSILAFTAFMAAYLATLWLQASAYRTSEVVGTLRALLLPGGATSARFASAGEVLDWVEGQLVAPAWRDPVCGDGACQVPWEFPAWGRFGCRADCGVEANTTRILVQVRSNFGGHPLLGARLLMAAARWNLCLLDAARRQRGDPDLCWFERDQAFAEVAATRLETMDVVDGSWYISVQGDYAGRVQGAAYSLQDPDRPQKLALQPEWVGCKMPRRSQLQSAGVSVTAAAAAPHGGVDGGGMAAAPAQAAAAAPAG